MIALRNPVRRKVAAPRRDLVVSLYLADGEALVEVREKGRRKGYAVTVPALFLILARRAADAAVAERKAKRGKRC